MEGERVYTLSQVGRHKSREDIWFTINGRVLDVAKFLEEHPGGKEVLLEYAGKDATEAFEAVGHSKEAHKLLSKFPVGSLQGYSKSELDCSNEKAGKRREMEAYVIKDDTEPDHSILVEFFLPALVAVVYLGYRCMSGAIDFRS